MKTVLCLLLLYSVNLCLAGVVDDGSALLQSNLADLSTDDSCIATGAGESSYKVSSPATLEDESLGADMGEAQVIEGTRADEIEARLAQARDYMHNVVYKDEAFSHVRDICVNKHSLCAFWAIIGECENNPGYMQVNCAPVCQSCEQLHVETRCPLDPNAKDALEPGDLNKMFERIISDPDLQQYEPVVLSRPSYVNGDTAENATYQIGIWMVMFENALSAEEAERMIELGDIVGRERSADVGDEQKDGTFSLNINPGRTSTNAWCTEGCYEDEVPRRLMQRVENITGIPEENAEHFQLLRYQENEFYQTHNDYIPYQRHRPCGVRILTFYFYLNDVEEGGGTNFPRMNATVQPKRGRAVLWPSVFDAHPNNKDIRSDHQALPVKKGVKYGANAWIHMRNFKTPNKKGC